MAQGVRGTLDGTHLGGFSGLSFDPALGATKPTGKLSDKTVRLEDPNQEAFEVLDRALQRLEEEQTREQPTLMVAPEPKAPSALTEEMDAESLDTDGTSSDPFSSDEDIELNPSLGRKAGYFVSKYFWRPCKRKTVNIASGILGYLGLQFQEFWKGNVGLSEYDAVLQQSENKLAQRAGAPLPHPSLRNVRATNSWFFRFQGVIPHVFPKYQQLYAEYDSNRSWSPAMSRAWHMIYKALAEGVIFPRDGFLYKLLWSSDKPWSTQNPDSDNIRAVFAELPRVLDQRVHKFYVDFEGKVRAFEQQALTHLTKKLGDSSKGKNVAKAFEYLEKTLEKDLDKSDGALNTQKVKAQFETLVKAMEKLESLVGRRIDLSEVKEQMERIEASINGEQVVSRKGLFLDLRDLKSDLIFKLWQSANRDIWDLDLEELESDSLKILSEHKQKAYALSGESGTEFGTISNGFKEILQDAYSVLNGRYRANSIDILKVALKEAMGRGKKVFETLTDKSFEAPPRHLEQAPQYSYDRLSKALAALQDVLYQD